MSVDRSWSSVARQWTVFAGIVLVVEALSAFAPAPRSPLDRGERFYPTT